MDNNLSHARIVHNLSILMVSMKIWPTSALMIACTTFYDYAVCTLRIDMAPMNTTTIRTQIYWHTARLGKFNFAYTWQVMTK